MKKAFTLVELLVVVVVIVTLMSITFRLSGLGGEAAARNKTITRMQRLENALSGYYAAFGSYPPVPLHANQNPFTRIDRTTGSQQEGSEITVKGHEDEAWESIRTACQAQPLAARFPLDSKYERFIEAVSKSFVERAASSDERYKAFQSRRSVIGSGFSLLSNPNDVKDWNSDGEEGYYWQNVKIFQFGLMSYLLPRYLFMTKGLKDSGLNNLEKCTQWKHYNKLAADQNTGKQFTSWSDQLGTGSKKSLIQRIPSQAVCARWLPNLEGIVSTTGSMRLYGIDVRESKDGGGGISVNNANIEIYRSGSKQYVLDLATVYDGWDNEFYYYSDPPHQNYRLWSAGPNGKTFAPWYPIENVKNEQDRKILAEWMADDIMYMSN